MQDNSCIQKRCIDFRILFDQRFSDSQHGRCMVSQSTSKGMVIPFSCWKIKKFFLVFIQQKTNDTIPMRIGDFKQCLINFLFHVFFFQRGSFHVLARVMRFFWFCQTQMQNLDLGISLINFSLSI